VLHDPGRDQQSESFSEFVKWLAFGGGVIAENDRVEQY
jgi:hypothetical protein